MLKRSVKGTSFFELVILLQYLLKSDLQSSIKPTIEATLGYLQFQSFTTLSPRELKLVLCFIIYLLDSFLKLFVNCLQGF